ncbi:GNAT family N-acetyltransferase [Desulfovibrio ferrophilus]|uniref:GCN5-related N-acetyltransferase n=1 Tax=Desulfovibrio ferrophilus TaxID=241368 RepID=A0A2Z6AWP2_9BACT|nr:GNAT family N-acetyltransferase [Desulfovibrio ferrophilus]BBD07672.1 GCN5-related N-acetyltransferase [Desulfovibrio ferrophilus]
MQNNIIIRQATPADIDTCLALETVCFPASEAASRESISIRIEQFPEGFYVAENQGQIVGQINSGATSKDDISDEAFKALEGHDAAGSNIVVFSLAVLPDQQGNGLGAQLMRHFIKQSRQQGRQQVLLLCKDVLVPFYSRLGFDDRGLSACTHGGAQWREMGQVL